MQQFWRKEKRKKREKREKKVQLYQVSFLPSSFQSLKSLHLPKSTAGWPAVHHFTLPNWFVSISILQRKIPAYFKQFNCHVVCWKGWTLFVLCPGWPCAYGSTGNLFPFKASRTLPSLKCIRPPSSEGAAVFVLLPPAQCHREQSLCFLQQQPELFPPCASVLGDRHREAMAKGHPPVSPRDKGAAQGSGGSTSPRCIFREFYGVCSGRNPAVSDLQLGMAS